MHPLAFRGKSGQFGILLRICPIVDKEVRFWTMPVPASIRRLCIFHDLEVRNFGLTNAFMESLVLQDLARCI
jgi:hypothetical protein